MASPAWMKLLHRVNETREHASIGAAASRDEEAPQPQPEQDEPGLEDPTPTQLSGRDYVAIVKRAAKEVGDDHLTNIAAALAYYGFLSIPSVLMVAVGIFALVGDPSAVNTLVDKLGGTIPPQAQSAAGQPDDADAEQGHGVSVLVIGSLLALWSVTGAMQNVMWGLNVAYERDETRGFFRRRMTALEMVGFGALGVLLSSACSCSGRTWSPGSATPPARRRSSRGCGGRRSGRS